MIFPFRITGAPLNEHNIPMMLPNGQIFGQKVCISVTTNEHFVFIFLCYINRSNRSIRILNEYFYSYFQAITQMSKENGIIVCPKTNELFVQPKIEKVYVM